MKYDKHGGTKATKNRYQQHLTEKETNERNMCLPLINALGKNPPNMEMDF